LTLFESYLGRGLLALITRLFPGYGNLPALPDHSIRQAMPLKKLARWRFVWDRTARSPKCFLCRSLAQKSLLRRSPRSVQNIMHQRNNGRPKEVRGESERVRWLELNARAEGPSKVAQRSGPPSFVSRTPTSCGTEPVGDFCLHHSANAVPSRARKMTRQGAPSRHGLSATTSRARGPSSQGRAHMII
jgi:hypothetical protein